MVKSRSSASGHSDAGGEHRRPGYLELHERGDLRARARSALEELADCHLCPRDCGVDRTADQVGVCRIGRAARVSSAFAHLGEEACLRGWRGSGTIFFTGCNLRCVFCQNYDISQALSGEELREERIADLALALQRAGCHNINLVTPEHVVPQAIEAIAIAAEGGLHLPIVYNTSAYDSLESLRLLDGIVDIYMPDFKVWESNTAKRMLLAPDYPDVARRAIREMHRQVGNLALDEKGLARRGILLRHLVMPNHLEESTKIFEWLASDVSRDTFVNIMGQYRPAWRVVGRPDMYTDIGRSLQISELQMAVVAARRAGLHRFDHCSQR
jgi:putative pyruvate formate lyase activating enzyme